MSFRSDSDERHLESPQTPSPTILPNRSTSEYKKEIQQQTAQSHSNVFSNAAVESQVPSTFSFGTESDLPRESIQLGTNSNLSSLPFRPAMTTRTQRMPLSAFPRRTLRLRILPSRSERVEQSSLQHSSSNAPTTSTVQNSSLLAAATSSVPKNPTTDLLSTPPVATNLMASPPVAVKRALQEARSESRRQRPMRFSVYEEPNVSTEGIRVSPSTTPTRTSDGSRTRNEGQKYGDQQQIEWPDYDKIMKMKQRSAKCDVVNVDLRELHSLLITTRNTPLTECYLHTQYSTKHSRRPKGHTKQRTLLTIFSFAVKHKFVVGERF